MRKGKEPMNNDLISRSDLLADLREKGFLPAIVQRAIERAPAVDAVEVVRCRECCHLENIWEPRGNHFCSYGERKEGADNG